MWRLYRPLFWFWWVIVVVVAGDLFLGGLGNCAYEAPSAAGCELLVDIRALTQLWVGAAASFLLVLGGLTLAVRPAYLRHEAGKGFALVKETKRLIPEVLGFQLLAPGRRPDPHRRLFYPTYTPRVAVDEEGATAKPAATEQPTLGQAATQTVTTDDGNVELFDFLYVLFTLLTIAFFLVTFVPRRFRRA